ncbi:hypothetical protein [Tenacibaculum sp. 47A_GOM-205m]|uniref:hypothetical protein n=1 Tax=Tenacibaculum sp. 47A_GOM-205m TaxID=1380384 RepID=UPI00048A9503|nr:hypothetical protein [Tenacibaculum sp. 47A_GOM-205m]
MSTQFYGDFAITGGNVKAAVAFSKNKNEATVTSVSLTAEHENGKIAAWGANNDFPQQFLKKIKPAGALRSGLRTNRKAHYGSGFVLAEETFEEGKRVITQKSIRQYPEIHEFFIRNQMKRFHKEIITDLEYFALAVPEYVLSNDFKKINRVKRQKTADFRYEIMNESTGLIENGYLSTKWAEGVDAASKFVSKVPLIDSYWSAEEVREYCKKKKIRNFIRPAFYPLINESYYPDPELHSIESSGWLDIINSIPKFKKAFLEERANINYHIEVYEEYFQKKYKEDWEGFTPEKRNQIQSEFVEELDAALRGAEKGGASLMSIIYKDDTGTPQPGLKITDVGQKNTDGKYLDDTLAGTQAALTAASVDPSIIGAGIPGGKLGAGSGSDKREGWLILSAMKHTDRETTLEPFEFIQQYNGWDPNLIGAFENTVLTTLDKNPTGTQKAAQI